MPAPDTQEGAPDLDHVCTPVYVCEGEVVCFECGALYIFQHRLDDESLALYREESHASA